MKKDHDLEKVKTSIAAGVNLDFQGCYGKTKLMWVIQKGYTNIVKEFIWAGANLDLKDILGNTALIYAVKSKRVDVVGLLIGLQYSGTWEFCKRGMNYGVKKT